MNEGRQITVLEPGHGTPHGELDNLKHAHEMLQLAGSPKELRRVADYGEAMRYAALKAGMGVEAQNEAAELTIRAMREIGTMLIEAELRTGPRNSIDSPGESITLPALLDMQRSQALKYSMKCQQIARIPEERFEARLAGERADRQELTSAAMYRYARNLLRDESREGIVLPEGEFPVLYADPPWEYDNSGLGGSASQHYSTMSTDRLAAAEGEGGLAWEVRRRTAENAVLFMWATNPLLEDALRVMNAWGFEYKTNMVWVKNRATYGKLGFYVMGRHELLLIGVRGSSLPRQGSQPPSVLDAPVGAHSAKPHEVYGLVESMYAGPYLELFARNRREGWTPFGDEVGNG